MTVGLSAANFANNVLNAMCRGIALSPAAPASNNVGLHTTDPGAVGTTNPTTGTNAGVRKAITFTAASAGTCASSSTPSWAVWDGGASVVVSHISVWDAITAGNFIYSAVLTTAKTVTTGDTFTLSSLSVSLAPVAA